MWLDVFGIIQDLSLRSVKNVTDRIFSKSCAHVTAFKRGTGRMAVAGGVCILSGTSEEPQCGCELVLQAGTQLLPCWVHDISADVTLKPPPAPPPLLPTLTFVCVYSQKQVSCYI